MEVTVSCEGGGASLVIAPIVEVTSLVGLADLVSVA